MSHFSRRSLLAGGAAALGGSLLSGRAMGATPDRRYLFVIGAMGGASIIDSFLPVRESASANGTALTTYADALVDRPNGSGFDCVKALPTSEISTPPYVFKADFAQSTFLKNHGEDMAVLTLESGSVNHIIAQQRALAGPGLNHSRNVLEAVGVVHGAGLPLPVCNMMSGGYSQPGHDVAIPIDGRQVTIADARTFAFATDGSKGTTHAVDAALLARARAARSAAEGASLFQRTFGRVSTLERYLDLRTKALTVEPAELINKLMLLRDPGLNAVGLSPSPELNMLSTFFPSIATDPFEAQAALAFLLVKYGASVSVGISVNNSIRTVNENGQSKIVNPQLSFDYSHNNHRAAQHTMWSRVLRVTDGLIRLLKTTEDPSHAGESFWKRSMVYIATDFGREKARPAGATVFSTGHHLNNGVVMLSPMINGNRVYGGVDPATCLTYGFDPMTGEADPKRVMTEGDIYSAVCGAMGVDFAGRTLMPALVKTG